MSDTFAATPGLKSTSSRTKDDPDFQYPRAKCVQCALYLASSGADRFLAQRQALTANSMLHRHRLELRLTHGLPSINGADGLFFTYDPPLADAFQKQEIFDFSQKAFAAPDDVLSVIFCAIKNTVPDSGEVLDSNGRKYILIYTNNPSADGVTWLHEIGHAAGRGHEPWGLGRPDKRYNFMATPAQLSDSEKAQALDPAFFRNTMFRPSVVAIAEAPFSVPSFQSALPLLSG